MSFKKYMSIKMIKFFKKIFCKHCYKEIIKKELLESIGACNFSIGVRESFKKINPEQMHIFNNNMELEERQLLKYRNKLKDLLK